VGDVTTTANDLAANPAGDARVASSATSRRRLLHVQGAKTIAKAGDNLLKQLPPTRAQHVLGQASGTDLGLDAAVRTRG